MSIYNIAEELKEYKQFVGWIYKYEPESEKPTKVPINIYTGQYASPTNPEHWCWFNELVNTNLKLDGGGFVISKDDPYTCLDFDSTDDPEIKAKQIQIYNAFSNSYSEISPSRLGCHRFIKAKLPANRKRSKVEIYTAGHFMTMTGWVIDNSPIKDYQELATQLWEEMEVKEVMTSAIDEPEVYSDYDILVMASQAVNGQKFMDLFDGKWQLHYNDDPKKVSCNEADFALINMLGFYSQNRAQIVRLFHQSALGKREKAKRQQYLNYMLNRCFDNRPEPINTEELKRNLEQQLAVKSQLSTVNSYEAQNQPNPASEDALGSVNGEQLRVDYASEKIHSENNILEDSNISAHKHINTQKFEYDLPPGLVGEIASFIYQAAPRPVPEIAIAGAIALMSGVCGRSYNISGTGLNQYTLILAMTGAGKESCANGIDKLMTEVQRTVPAASEFVGPGEIASPQALMKFMNKTSRCFLSIVGEFGLRFKQMADHRANGNEVGLKRIFLDLYNKSGQSSILKPLIYSDKDKNTEPIHAPAFSMLGETTPETFYENLNANLISDGLLPRFTIIEYHGKRPQLNENHLYVQPSQYLLDQFSALCAYSLQLNNGNNVLQVQLSDDALQLYKSFDKLCDSKINDASNDVSRQLWNRAHIKALKLGALLAVGCNYINPVIDKACAEWSLKLIINDVTNLLTRFETGDIGANNVQNEQTIEIKKAFKKYVSSSWEQIAKFPGATQQTYNLKIVPHSFITAFCRQRACFKNDKLGPILAVKNVIASLIDCDDIRELSPQDKRVNKLANNMRAYMISGMQL